MSEICCENCREIYPDTDFPNKKLEQDICKYCLEDGYEDNLLFKYKNGYCYACQDKGIEKRASYGYNIKIACVNHKTNDMINLIHINDFCIECKKNGMFKMPSFGYENDGKKLYCSEHKLDNMINLVDKNKNCIVCSKKSIRKRGCYGYEDDNEKLYCSKHKLYNMINLSNKHIYCNECKKNNINKLSSYGYLEYNEKIRCFDHKIEGMINLNNINNNCITCINEGEFCQANFGFKKDNIRLMCSKHKLNGMIDLVHKKDKCIKCSKENINKTASFGFKKDMKKISCSKHKTPDMINIVDIKGGCVKCIKEDKFTKASFGYILDMKKTHCSKHKTPDMINLTDLNRCCIICKENKIYKIAGFGKIFEKKIHCLTHKLDNEYSNNNPKCQIQNCKEKPFYGQINKDILPARCEKHKLSADIDMISRECKICMLDVFIPSSNNTCYRCLGIENSKNRRGLKEEKIHICLTTLSKYMGIREPVRDMKIKDGCSKRRPDFYYRDFNDNFSLIIEVDEHQHTKYSCSIEGELKRMIILYEEDNGGFPLIFIRFNPDAYYYNNKIMNKYDGREKILSDVIRGLKNRTDILMKIGVIYLYYDNFNSLNIKIQPLDYHVNNGVLNINHNYPLSRKNKFNYPL